MMRRSVMEGEREMRRKEGSVEGKEEEKRREMGWRWWRRELRR